MSVNKKFAISWLAITAAIPLASLYASDRDRGSHDLYDRFHNYDYSPYNYRGYSQYEYPYYQQDGYYFYYPNNQSHLQPDYIPDQQK